ncbi:hypothetical protein L596_011453 [Steinernema carpocapsae]|uniref:Uncharacterized protein n=1 Tax=Steinernema carpocapsae TaxID=34508 RepID=A0A4U5NUE6_STECR|nr:hypothetical protein L596_011453 [Steinernema carpocapsae]
MEHGKIRESAVGVPGSPSRTPVARFGHSLWEVVRGHFKTIRFLERFVPEACFVPFDVASNRFPEFTVSSVNFSNLLSSVFEAVVRTPPDDYQRLLHLAITSPESINLGR